jgi:hypothetical protein
MSGVHLGEVEQEASEQEKERSGRVFSAGSVPDFEIFPEYLRKGSWSPAAFVYLACFSGWLVWSSGDAISSYFVSVDKPKEDNWLLWVCLAVYCLGINAFVITSYGPWPFVSYTLWTYILVTGRLVSQALGLHVVAECLRFPMLAMAWVTTTVWWIVLVPLMSVFMPGGTPARWKFLKFNLSFFLLNVHLFELPLAMISHNLTWRPLIFFDLWSSLVIALLYVLFYLLVLDKNGLHFYIFLSPRRAWCCVPGYSMVLAIYVGIYSAFG